MKCILRNGKVSQVPFTIENRNSTTYVTICRKFDFSKISYIDFEYEKGLASNGDAGYFVLPNPPACEGMLCSFKEREDIEYRTDIYTMPIFGVKTKTKSFVAIVSGMAFSYTLVCGVKNGSYYVFPRFEINGEQPYEDICVEYHYLSEEDADYSGMAREYRRYQLERGACRPLKERAAKNPVLYQAIESPLIRIRMGWKPMPPKVLHQTPETEPPMHVACTFKTVEQFAVKLKESGVEMAEITLVGWNAKGHDGRWPAAFPVEEALGGEEDLKHLVNKLKSLGYLISCHTNSTDTYEVSPMWDEDDLLTDRNGDPMDIGEWSGGHGYALCPACAKKQAEEILPRVQALGFRGLHYVDVLNIVRPRICYNKKHPLNRGQAISCNNAISSLSQKLFGGYSSEGVIDFAASYLDYGLYVSFSEKAETPLCDKNIPLWQLVYHGIIMSNPCATTVNYPVKGERAHLKVLEYGGRPSMYLYSKFVAEENRNWMGDVDLTCDDEADMDRTIAYIKDAYEEWKKVSYLQTAYMENHCEISSNVYEVRYSDGSILTVDYNTECYTLNKT